MVTLGGEISRWPSKAGSRQHHVSMQAKGRAKVRDAVRWRMGKPTDAAEARPRSSRARPSWRRTANWFLAGSPTCQAKVP